MKAELLDEYGDRSDTVEVPEPLPLTVVNGGKVYLRLAVKVARYRLVSSHWANETPTDSFKVVRGNGD